MHIYFFISSFLLLTLAISNSNGAEAKHKILRGKKLTHDEKKSRHEKRQKFVNEVNKKTKHWKAKVHSKFAVLDEEVVQKMQGTKVRKTDSKQLFGGRLAHQMEQKPVVENEPELVSRGEADPGTFEALLTNDEKENAADTGKSKRQVTCYDYRFDIRQKWPQCASIISNIRDQSLCGSCWAVAAAAAYTDRHCIQAVKQGKKVPSASDNSAYFSAADVMQCSGGCDVDACEGGWPSKAWEWYAKTGVVSGHNYSQGGCKPYPFPTTQEAANEGIQLYTYNESCSKSCTNTKHPTPYKSDKSMASDWHSLYTPGWEQNMKEEIFHNGTITAGMIVYADFMDYTSGIYHHVYGSEQGGHAIRLIGYGLVNCSDGTSVKYWLAANEWNTDWGEQGGYFRIKRGTDESNIESMEVSFGTPIV